MSTPSSVKSACATFQYTRRYTPKCDLAQLIVDQMSQQQLRASQLVKNMGYPSKHTIAAIDRLRSVLCSPNLGLDGSYIDAYYDARGFITTLCEILEIESEYYQQQISQLQG